MSAIVRELLQKVEAWPEEDQEELAELVRVIEARRTGIYRLSDEERAAVRQGMDAARRGEFAADDEIEKILSVASTGMIVRFTRPAQADLQRIYEYINKIDPIAATRTTARLIERARLLADTPYEGRETDAPKARVIVVPRLRYFIFYTVEMEEIHITHFRHTARRRPDRWQRWGS
jgi:plasmid stabilization system protein ParE